MVTVPALSSIMQQRVASGTTFHERGSTPGPTTIDLFASLREGAGRQ